MPKLSYPQYLAAWDQLLAAAERNPEQMEHAGPVLAQLREAVATLREARQRHAVLQAQFQQVTRDGEAAVARGNEAAVRLRLLVHSVYGSTSEKLGEFGMVPRRAPKRKRRQPTAGEGASPEGPKPRKPRRRTSG